MAAIHGKTSKRKESQLVQGERQDANLCAVDSTSKDDTVTFVQTCAESKRKDHRNEVTLMPKGRTILHCHAYTEKIRHSRWRFGFREREEAAKDSEKRRIVYRRANGLAFFQSNPFPPGCTCVACEYCIISLITLSVITALIRRENPREDHRGHGHYPA